MVAGICSRATATISCHPLRACPQRTREDLMGEPLSGAADHPRDEDRAEAARAGALPLAARRAAVGLGAICQGGKASRAWWGKGIDSRYENGPAFGRLSEDAVNRRQEFVIGGSTISGKPFDALIFGYDEGQADLFAARLDGDRHDLGPHLLQDPKGQSQSRLRRAASGSARLTTLSGSSSSCTMIWATSTTNLSPRADRESIPSQVLPMSPE
jgi:hypothetical protein